MKISGKMSDLYFVWQNNVFPVRYNQAIDFVFLVMFCPIDSKFFWRKAFCFVIITNSEYCTLYYTVHIVICCLFVC